MEKCFIKELSAITNISIQTLHYYDRIDLLKPSDRLVNGYRVYSKQDLLKLQQIMTLKYFGFNLTTIKKIVEGEANVFEHFSLQTKLLEKKAQMLLLAHQNLKKLLSDIQNQESPPWQKIIQFMEVYHMTQNLEKSWISNILTADELKQYAIFKKEIKEKSTPKDKEAFT